MVLIATYDSTDMAALNYRLKTLHRDWIIYVTDLRQANHFQMCFDVARSAGWVSHQRLDHIGVGAIQIHETKQENRLWRREILRFEAKSII